jgi:hypothetical protein
MRHMNRREKPKPGSITLGIALLAVDLGGRSGASGGSLSYVGGSVEGACEVYQARCDGFGAGQILAGSTIWDRR